MLIVLQACRLAETNRPNPKIQVIRMNLTHATEGKEYIIRDVITDDEELNAFLFSLGCYSGEPITVITFRKGGCTVALKDARYSIDTALAAAILI